MEGREHQARIKPESLLGFRLHDTPQVAPAMQDSENLHYVTIKATKDHIRLDESAAEVRSDLRAATADLREEIGVSSINTEKIELTPIITELTPIIPSTAEHSLVAGGARLQ